MATDCGCRACRERAPWISERQFRAWEFLRYLLDRDRASGREGGSSVTSDGRYIFSLLRQMETPSVDPQPTPGT